MTFKLIIEPQAIEDIGRHKKSGSTAILNKINSLLVELMEHPETGTGKPEKLKYDFSGRWSRRINREHRLVYSVDNDTITVYVITAWGHYN